MHTYAQAYMVELGQRVRFPEPRRGVDEVHLRHFEHGVQRSELLVDPSVHLREVMMMMVKVMVM